MVFDSIQTRERSIADSLRRAKDTTARGVKKGDAAGARPPRPPAVRQDSGAVRVDTARIQQLLRGRPVPTDRWVARTGTKLIPGSKYLVRVRATNLSGATANGEAVLNVPATKEPDKRDSTRAAPPGKTR
jgi:hypothetical protein